MSATTAMSPEATLGKQPAGGHRITMLVENAPYPQDPRVRQEAESLADAGHSVCVIAPRRAGQTKRETIRGVEVRRFRSVKMAGRAGLFLEYAVAASVLNVAAVLALFRGSVVLHLHNPPELFFPTGALFRLVGRQVVFDHHDLSPELAEVLFGRGLLYALARLCERLTFGVSTHVVAANISHAEVAQTRGHKRAEQVTVVRNGPDRSWTERPLNLRRGALESVQLVYVGNVAPQDGLDGMAEVLACLRELTPVVPALLTVIGDGDALPQVRAAMEAHGVSEDVRMLGWQPPACVPALIENADIGVDPAPSTPLNERSTMIKVMEYMALGKPVVAYDLCESRRTLGDAGTLVRPGDARAFAEQIALLARDPVKRMSLARSARERARELTWDNSEPALIAAYGALTHGHRGGRTAGDPLPADMTPSSRARTKGEA
jgi:glycosyltransferase involved in cell wall biosynthesis